MSEERFDRIDATLEKLASRFDGVDRRLDGVDRRLDGVERRLDGVERRLDGVDGRLDGVEQRLGAVETGLEKLNVLHEDTRGKVGLVLEHVAATNERLDRFQHDVNVRFNKVDADVRLVLENHTRRIQALEQR